MNSKRKAILLLIAGITLAILSPASIYAACSSIPNGSFPKTLQGNTTYCLTSNVTVNGTSAFTIGGDNITFDLNGFEINNTVPGTGSGIESGYVARTNIIIKNGRINGFRNAIELSPQFHDNVLIDGIVAANSLMDGIMVEGRSVVVSNCKITSASMGIIVMGSDIHVINNDIAGAASTGIHLNWGGGSRNDDEGQANIIENNRISNRRLVGYSTGIMAIIGTDAIVVNNRISNMSTGIEIRDTGKYRDNLTFNCPVPYNMSAGVIDAGNNN